MCGSSLFLSFNSAGWGCHSSTVFTTSEAAERRFQRRITARLASAAHPFLSRKPGGGGASLRLQTLPEGSQTTPDWALAGPTGSCSSKQEVKIPEGRRESSWLPGCVGPRLKPAEAFHFRRRLLESPRSSGEMHASASLHALITAGAKAE